MTVSLAFVILSFIYSMILAVEFFKKPRVKSYENRLFSFLIIMNFLGLILEILCNLVMISGDLESTLCIVVNRGLLSYLSLFMCTFSVYVLIVAYKGTKIDEYYELIKPIFFSIWILFEVLICLLPLHLFIDGELIYSFGPAANAVYIISAVCLLICLYAVLKNIKNIINKKYIPIIGFIIGGVATAIIQKMYPSLTISTSVETIILFLMYFSIENPDLKMIKELNLARDQAEKANNAKTEFLSSMSHEIRTPLNAIVSFSNSLMKEDMSEKCKEDLKCIVGASSNLLELVNGILDISKIEANKIEIVNKEYNLQEVLDNLTSLSKARLGEKPIEFRTNFDPSIPQYLFGDANRIKQICINLLTNSIKYTNEGFIEFKVNSVKSGDVVRLIFSVEDSGIGIKKEDVSKLFEKFSRLDIEKNVSIEGSGLGLAITKKLIDMMGGKIVVQSEYGKGSKFTVAIDQKIIDAPKEVIARPVPDDLKLEFPGKRVLVVDDNTLNLKVAARVLEPFKVEVITAKSGDEGIEKIVMDGNFDLVLMDDMMPNKSGTETLKELKENIEDYKIPTVALTANAINGMREKYLAQGFDEYLSKPIEEVELKRVLNQFLK